MSVTQQVQHGDACIACSNYIEHDEPAIPHSGNGRGEVRMCKPCSELATNATQTQRVEQGTASL